jgi:hypothetical protein
MATASSRPRPVNDASPVEPAEPVGPPRSNGRVVDCCWPIGEPGTREFRFCDLPSEPGRPYCEEHLEFAKAAIGRARSAGFTEEWAISGGGAGVDAVDETARDGSEGSVKVASPGNDPGQLPVEDQMTRQLRKGFAEATRQAVRDAHAVGLAVPARTGGVAVEIRPDGEVAAIDNDAPWSPVDWRNSARR